MGKYRLRRVIGEGASSTVYSGVSESGEEVAVKVVSKRGRSAGAVYREIKMLGEVEHENVVRVIDKFESGNHVYVVEELCDLNLVSFLNEYEVDEDIALKILRMILCGVRHIHSVGIIHRDLKLGNILLRGNTVKICDFGLSCHVGEHNNEFCGTVDYIAPEISDGKEYSVGVDMWSVGIILYVLLTKRKFCGSSGPLECSEELKDLLGRLLERDETRRIGASEALMHRSFRRFIPKCEDFRDLPDFKRDTKYGVVKKTGDVVELGNVRIVARREGMDVGRHGRPGCLCGSVFVYSVLVGLEKVEPAFITNGGLRILSVLAAHVSLMRRRTAKAVVDSDGDKFYYMFSGGFAYVCKGFTLRTKGEGYEMVVGGAERTYHKEIPGFLEGKIAELRARCEEADKEVCWFSRGSPLLLDCLSHQPLSVSCVSQVSEMSIRSKTSYDHIEGIGWCVKNGLNLMFLTNDGERFEVMCSELMVRWSERMLPIDDTLPLGLRRSLKSILPFLWKMV